MNALLKDLILAKARVRRFDLSSSTALDRLALEEIRLSNLLGRVTRCGTGPFRVNANQLLGEYAKALKAVQDQLRLGASVRDVIG